MSIEGENKGISSYKKWHDELVDTPEKRRFYEKVAAEQQLWLDLAEARIYGAGLTEEQIAEKLGTTTSKIRRMEKNPFSYKLKTLSKYVQALGEGYSLEVKVVHPK